MMLWTRILLTFAIFLARFLIMKASHFTLDLECQPNCDVIIQNPDFTLFKSATAGTNTTVCNVTKSIDATVFTIIGCPKSEDIFFTLSVREGTDATGDGIISGSYSETYVIRCQEIVNEGVMFNTSTSLNISTRTTGNETTNETESYIGAPVTPSFVVISMIWNSNITQTVSTANVGELLKWKVEGPYEYDLLPYHCTANPGTILGTPPVVPVILQGCSVLDMVTNFVAASGTATEKGSLVSDLYAFKFHTSDQLTIACSVKICTRGDAACTVDCSKRRRRQDMSIAATDLTGTKATVVSHLTIRNTGAATSGLSYVLGILVFVTALGQTRRYQWI
ncbi:uncharacterized protein LOC132714993 isoform X2 [Ruditapes philippinarum]|uniref:uncharacterized protein LOC132714993 isoform X2 n=1 Tax=Ruditapes philippinarum TaxID=129788 RepID=UPI00295AC07D|nr:uncharacterized protein LOC132714993 isoform X2 [Ruditapes philippinarum]